MDQRLAFEDFREEIKRWGLRKAFYSLMMRKLEDAAGAVARAVAKRLLTILN